MRNGISISERLLLLRNVRSDFLTSTFISRKVEVGGSDKYTSMIDLTLSIDKVLIEDWL